MTPKEAARIFGLPEECPIPGAVYRRKLSDGQWEFATITGLQVLPRARWVAIFSSVRYGDENITSEINKLDKFQLHSIPDMGPILSENSEAITNGKDDSSLDELDLLLAAGA